MMNQNMVHKNSFRYELITIRRKMLGESQSTLAANANLTQGTVSKIEQGLHEPSEEQLLSISNALNCPISFFFQKGREYGAPLSSHPMFRKKASVGIKAQEKLIAELNVRIAHLKTLLNSVEFEPELPFPEYDLDENNGDVEQIANNIRRAWYVPDGPITPLIEYAERAGCIISICDLGHAKIDGASYKIPGLPPLIFLNKELPSDRMRFSLAHEIGHLVMHRYPTPEMEKEADNFASALLMPKRDISFELSNLTLEKAALLKRRWKVSMAAIIFKAASIGRITKGQSDYLWRTMSARGYRMREPAELDFKNEETSVINALIDNLTCDLGYSCEDLEKSLHLNYSEIAKLYNLKKPSLKLVK